MNHQNRGSPEYLVSIFTTGLLFTASASLIAAEPSGPLLQVTQTRCNVGTIVKTFGKADWQVKACNDGSLMFMPAPTNGASHPFTYRYGEMESPNVEERFRDKRARAAYLEVKSLTTEQFAALLREIRASAEDR